MTRKITVAIADDHQMVINGIQKMLSGDKRFELTDTFLTGNEMLEGLQKRLPDVLLLDIQLPDITGDKLTGMLLKRYPQLRILILTNFDSLFYLKSMIQHGALGYLLKSTDQKKLFEAIETVYDNREFLEPAMKTMLDEKKLKHNRQSVQQPVLSAREKEIIQLIADGYTTQEIADKLFLGFTTVENYRFNILTKFGVKNTAVLIKRAVMLGIVQ